MLIGEVAGRTGVSVRMLRYYDAHGLVTPSHRTSGGYRDYSRADLERLMKVESLRSLGMGVAEVRAALDATDASGATGVAAVVDRLRAETLQRIDEEQALLAQLDSLRGHGDNAPDSWDDVLAVTSLLTALRSRHPVDRQAAALRSVPGLATDALVTSYLAESDPNAAGTLRWSLARAGEDVVPPLVARVDSADAPTRLRIVEALDAVAGAGDATAAPQAEPAEPSDPTALTALQTLADDPDPTVRSRAVLAVARRTDQAPDARLTGLLVSLVTDGDHDVDAAEALTSLCRRHPEAGEAVVAHLVAAGSHVSAASAAARLRTVQALAELADSVAAAVPALAGFTADPDRTVARTALALSRPSRDGRTCRGR
jgi:DNA-binding transcriptional MerR regulator